MTRKFRSSTRGECWSPDVYSVVRIGRFRRKRAKSLIATYNSVGHGRCYWSVLILRSPIRLLFRHETARNDRHRSGAPRRLRGFEPLESRQLLAVNILFDYSLDSNGFFTDPTRRALLESAGEMIASRLGDDLAATPARGPSDTWTLKVTHPGNNSTHSIVNPDLAADTVTIFAGGRDLGGSAGHGGTHGLTVSGSQSFIDTILSRGETGELDSPPTDYGPWAGISEFQHVGCHRLAFRRNDHRP